MMPSFKYICQIINDCISKCCKQEFPIFIPSIYARLLQQRQHLTWLRMAWGIIVNILDILESLVWILPPRIVRWILKIQHLYYRYRFNNRRSLTGACRVPDSFSLLGVRVTFRGVSKCHRAPPTPPVCRRPGPLVSGEGQPASKWQFFGQRKGAIRQQMTIISQRQGTTRRQMAVLWSAARGNPPTIGSCFVSGKGQFAGNWQLFRQRQGATRRQLAVVWSAERGNPPAIARCLVSGKGQTASKWNYSLAFLLLSETRSRRRCDVRPDSFARRSSQTHLRRLHFVVIFELVICKKGPLF